MNHENEVMVTFHTSNKVDLMHTVLEIQTKKQQLNYNHALKHENEVTVR